MYEHEDHIGYELKSLSKRIKAHINRSIAKSGVIGENVTAAQGYVLGYICHNSLHRDVFQRDIEQSCHIQKSTATGILRLLEKNGWITREAVDYDARLKKITLTQQAREHQQHITALINETEALLIQDIPLEDLDCFHRVIAKMKANLE